VLKGIAELSSDTVIDGEMVALDEEGRPSFNLLQGFGNAQTIVLYAFDLLMLRGKDVRLWPLEDRREQLREIIASLPDVIRFSETFNVPLPELMGAVRKHQLEGIVAKRVGSLYRSGERSSDWVKWRANRGQEFVAGGYIPGGCTRFTPGRILRGTPSDVRGQRPRRLLTRIPSSPAPALRAAPGRAMSVRQSARQR
jgi:bifunctional non-homologous end joining protein LigD